MHVQYIVANKNAFLCCEFLFLSSFFAHSSYFCGQFFVAPTILWFSFFCWVHNRKTHVASISHFYLLPVRIVVTEYELWLLFATFFLFRSKREFRREKKRNVWKTGNIANYMCRSFSIFRKINARNLKKILTILKEKYVCEFSQDFVVFQCVQCALCNVHSFTMDLYRLATLACVQFPWITK